MRHVSPASVATRNGVIAGVILGILSLPILTISGAERALGRLTPLPTLFLLVAVIVFLVIGFLAARRNGLVRSGVWSGFLAGLITAFIAVCLGIVILTLLAPFTLAAAHAARRARHGAGPLLARVVIVRLLLVGLALMVAGAIAGLLGGALGRIGRPHPSGGTGAGYTTPPPPPPSGDYAPAPAQPFAGSYPAPPAQPYVDPNPTPLMNATPTPYYSVATPYDDDAPTTFQQSEG